MTRRTLLGFTLLLLATSAFATTFVVPTDDQMVSKSDRILIGTVEGSFVQEGNGTIETVYEIRVERSIKGGAATGELQRIVSAGGIIGKDRGLIVPASAHFEQGERVLVFLTKDERGRFRTTDMTLGRFEFVTSTRGERLLVRAMEDVVGWDFSGQVHHEKVRKESGFLQFVEDRAHGRKNVVPDYTLDAADVTFAPEATTSSRFTASANAAAFPAPTYTDYVNNQPVRWPNIAAGVTFYKRSDQNIAGAADGGVAAIQSGLAAWNNEPNSNINLIYGGQRATASANHDGVNVVEYNDPQSRISGSWTGAGTVAVTFLSFAGTHSFAGATWLNITDADVVFQNGYSATNAAFGTAMTHELGHGIGWRHSNQDYATGGACNSATQECTSAAIMNSSVNANYNYTLQPWDINAAQSVYPGASTCTAPAITTHPTSRTINSGTSTTLTVGATGTGTLTYQWYIGTSGNTASPISGATGTSLTVAPTSTTSYWVRVSNSCGSANSSTATVTVSTTPTCTPPSITTQPTSRTITSGSSTTFTVAATGTAPLSYQWYIGTSGTTTSPISGATSATLTVAPTTTTSYWVRVSNACGSANSSTATATVTAPPPARKVPYDFNGDGKSDILWRQTPSGDNAIWLINSFTFTGSYIQAEPLQQRRVAGIGDFDGDGNADILWRDSQTGANIIWLMNGFQVKSSSLIRSEILAWDVAGIGDFNGDGRSDILWRNKQTGENAIWMMNGFTFTGGYIRSEILSWTIAGVGDFNADGKSDILWRTPGTGENAIWLMNGFTLASGSYITSQPTAWTVGGVGDFDGDSRSDILWRNPSTGANAIWEMSGFTVTASSTIASQPTTWAIGGIGDYNGDGKYDIFWRSSAGENVFWMMNGFTIAASGNIRSEITSWQPVR